MPAPIHLYITKPDIKSISSAHTCLHTCIPKLYIYIYICMRMYVCRFLQSICCDNNDLGFIAAAAVAQDHHPQHYQQHRHHHLWHATAINVPACCCSCTFFGLPSFACCRVPFLHCWLITFPHWKYRCSWLCASSW